jgi:hypothetical protein
LIRLLIAAVSSVPNLAGRQRAARARDLLAFLRVLATGKHGNKCQQND